MLRHQYLLQVFGKTVGWNTEPSKVCLSKKKKYLKENFYIFVSQLNAVKKIFKYYFQRLFFWEIVTTVYTDIINTFDFLLFCEGTHLKAKSLKNITNKYAGVKRMQRYTTNMTVSIKPFFVYFVESSESFFMLFKYNRVTKKPLIKKNVSTENVALPTI